MKSFFWNTIFNHTIANYLEKAIAIAKRNPEFAFISGAKIEVRPIKMREQSTNYIYPKGI